MRALVAYSLKQTGRDPVLLTLAEELRKIANGRAGLPIESGEAGWEVEIYCVESDDIPPVDYDMIVLVDAIEWYFSHRFTLPGRPWVCLLSLHLESVIPILRGVSSAFDAGINAIFTNSPAFVSHMSAAIPTSFIWQPVDRRFLSLPGGSRPVKFGTVIPNVIDRDFSQVLMTHAFLKSKGYTGVDVYLPESETMRLPDEAGNQVKVSDANLFDAFSQVEYYIPAPRITDLRGGIIPTELMQAFASGCIPLVFFHPLLNPLKDMVSPLFTSLESYKASVGHIARGGSVGTVSVQNDMLPSPRQVADRIWVAYKRHGRIGQ
ncbi:hypothetical protein [Candidatus Magnetobacterium casense]|uniref:Uncharacterized protein n=1 Tax=Candidatus Magnetobacterium casense TaxID=1455061 RepID=A0ABS6S1J6_9BACT|nr:hypothetical protein [Candidatus Magnetobacterium casensis]MBV6342719.1 hypothetical protein [Candidatus Magnetobacterium casensis]